MTEKTVRTLRKVYPSVTMLTTNPTLTALIVNTGLRSEKLMTNRLSYGTAGEVIFVLFWQDI
jgi:hypothetical protein